MSIVEADVEQVKVLIEQKCNIHQIDEQGRTALHYCAENETIDCARLLLADDAMKNSILNLQDHEGYSALHLACLNGNNRMVKFLCEQGADVTLVDKESHSLIHWITVCGYVDLIDIVRKYPTPMHTVDIYGAFPIHYASQLCVEQETSKGLEILKKLIELNADVNCLDEQKRTPFMWAASAGAIDALRLLYKAGANPMHVDKDSLNALHCAATHGHISCIRMLVELYGCPLESEDVNGCTALFYAVTLHHSNACQMLLDLKANPNHQDTRGRTPSHCAALKGNMDCLKRLVTSQADIWIKNKRGDYPIHEAIHTISFSKLQELQTGCSDVVRYIFELYPTKIHIRNGEQRTSLHLAASLGNIDMCKVLIECGARIHSLIHTSSGNYITPYDLARIHHQDACADYLAYNHGCQRGNLLVQIFARRIQRFFRRCRIARNSTVRKSMAIRNHLLTQAKLCLDNKILADRQKTTSTDLSSSYLTKTNIVEEKPTTSEQHRRRHTFAKSSKTIMTSVNHEVEKVVIVHTSNSIATSVKLYERHKLIAEELFKLKQARIHNHSIVINRPLYKILIENAFNPHSRSADEIEKYLETLLKAYEMELEAIRRRTKSVSPRRVYNNSQRITKQQK